MKSSWLALPPYGWSTTYLVDIFLFNKDSSHHGNFSSAWQLKSGMAKLALGAVSCAHSAHLEVMCTVHIVHVANRSSKSCKRYVTIFFLQSIFWQWPSTKANIQGDPNETSCDSLCHKSAWPRPWAWTKIDNQCGPSVQIWIFEL